MARTALVTGGNRGIGLETCRGLAKAGLHVLLASRDAALGKAAAADLKAQGLDVEAVTLDVAQPSSIQACVDGLTSRGVQVDVLVNNAGIYPEPGILDGDPALLTEALQVHVVGPAHLCRLLMPAMNARGYGRVVNVSSGLGAFSEGMQGGAAYCISKAAMNALTMCVAQEAKGDVTVNAMCPGWVATRMGGAGAPKTPEEGADTAVWLATQRKGGPHGGFYRERQRIPW